MIVFEEVDESGVCKPSEISAGINICFFILRVFP